jgi:hypothetical protein
LGDRDWGGSYPYKLLKPGSDFHGAMVASIDDIACMKLDAVSSRGTKRDFIDLYFIAKERPLPLLLGLFQERYGDVQFSLMHIKKSLVYFEDGESDR